MLIDMGLLTVVCMFGTR